MGLLAVPSPSPSAINVTVSVPPDATLDNATLALAIFTGTLAVFTIVLAIIGLLALRLQGREISHNEKQLELARAELKATQEQLVLTSNQLDLGRQQFEAAREAARPELEVGVFVPTPSVIQVSVTYITGSEPAYDVSVWVRSASGYFAIGISTVAAGNPPRTLLFPSGFSQLDDDAIANTWPFPYARRAMEANNHIMPASCGARLTGPKAAICASLTGTPSCRSPRRVGDELSLFFLVAADLCAAREPGLTARQGPSRGNRTVPLTVALTTMAWSGTAMSGLTLHVAMQIGLCLHLFDAASTGRE